MQSIDQLGKFDQIFKEELTSILLKLLHKIEKKGRLSNTYFEVSTTLIPKPDKKTTRKKSIDQYLWSNMNAKILNKVLANQIQDILKGYIPWPRGIYPWNGSTYANW